MGTRAANGSRSKGRPQDDYNVTAQVTVTGALTFTYAVAMAPATPATGTITAASGLGKDSDAIGVTDLVLDDGTILHANRYTELRLIGGGAAALGRRFEVSNTIETDETPSQTKDKKFIVLIVNL
jgi:hypothetical protein